MKSIVEEASSISKAIENAWKRAEQPTEFSVRIHELAEKNMFGFTSKPAKIALFYQDTKKDKAVRHVSHTSSTAPIPSVAKPTIIKTTQKNNAEPKNARQAQRATRAERPERTEKSEGAEPWTSEMIAYSENWLRDLLQKLEVKNAQFQTAPQRYHLKITFAKPVFEEEEKNRLFFRNCAHLVLQATRNAFKRPLKGFKAILTTEQS